MWPANESEERNTAAPAMSSDRAIFGKAMVAATRRMTSLFPSLLALRGTIVASMRRDTCDFCFQGTCHTKGNCRFCCRVIDVSGFAENTGCRSNQQSVAALLSHNDLEEFPQTQKNARKDMINCVAPLPEPHVMEWNIGRLPRSC